MPQLSSGQTASLVLAPGDSYNIGTTGVVTVKGIYGAPSTTTTLNANFAVFGPYGVPAKLDIACTSGNADYGLIGPGTPATWNATQTALVDPKTGEDVAVGGGGGGGGGSGSGLVTGRTITVGSAAVLTDEGTIILANSASAIAVTIPNDSTVAWEADSVIAVYQVGAGVASFAQGSGVTLRVPSSYAASVQYDTIFARRVGANEWVVSK